MKRVLRVLCSLFVSVFLLCALVPHAWAAMITLTPSVTTASPGDPLTITVNVVDFPELVSYDFTVLFDDLELDVVTPWTNSTPFTSFLLTDPIISDPNNGTGGSIGDISYGAFSGPSGSFVLGTIDFLVVSPVTDGLVDVSIDFLGNDDIITGPFFEPITDAIDMSLANATVNAAAIPEPASMLLIGTGLVGLVFISRKRG